MNKRKVSLCKGFTLLEILLSITVVVALTLVFVPTIQRIQQQKSVNAATLQMNTIANAASQYYSMYQVWPQDLSALNPLLGYTGTTPNPFCSVWKGQNGCTPYTMASASSSHYFALSVVVPNPTVAMKLVKSLPVAYTDGTTVTAYTTVFRGFKPVPPSGVLFSANSKQLSGNCTSSTQIGQSTPFSGCIDSSDSLPYGLINVAQYNGQLVPGNNFGNSSGYHGASINPNTITCPMGTAATMFYLPVGVWNLPGKTGVYPQNFFLSEAHFITQGNTQKLCLTSRVGTNDAGTDLGGNFFAGFGDVVCLPSGAVTRWPDGPNSISCNATV
ncbi:MAG: hypothetical protein K0R48_132 [Gammaproteobacteria bacterium]|jgi:type II secretory pathway pseudopilin PulG|nr:hypothetical protein [Gammaproteobacteria bacterium]